jgi:hypothetical protein
MKNYFLAAVAIMVVLGCSNQAVMDGDVQIIPIRFDKFEKLSMSDIISRMEVIELEGGTEAYMGDPGKLDIENNRYYIIDDAVHSIFVFDSTGHFLYNTKSRRGRGHNEHINPNDYYIEDGNICIMDYDGTVKKYDQSLNMVESFSAPIAGVYRDIERLSDDIVAWSSSQDWVFYSISNDSVIGTYKAPDRRLGGIGFGRERYYQNDRQVLYRFNDNGYSLYRVDKDDCTLKEAYRYKVDRDEFDASLVDETERVSSYLTKHHSEYCILMDMAINNRYLVSLIGYLNDENEDVINYCLKSGNLRLSFYSLENGKQRLIENAFKGDKFILGITGMDDTAIYTLLPVIDNFTDLLPYMYDNSLIDDDSRKRIKNAGENTNALIIKYYLRDDIL